MKKTIVTGGAGFIGSHIVDSLVDLGHDVHIIDNMSSGTEINVNPKAVLHKLDIRNFEEIKDLFIGATYVFHEAALPQVQFSIENPIETHEVNVTGTLNVLEASRQALVKRVIFASSSAIYGDQETLPYIESMPALPLSPYGAHKYIGEVYCKLYSKIYNLESVCLRYFNVYGPRQSVDGAYPSVIAKFIDMYKKGDKLTITGNGEQTRSFVHVSDIVNANILAMQSENIGCGEIINIGTNENYSINRIADLIGGEIDYIAKRIEPFTTSADINKAKQKIGWEPKINIENGIKELKIYNNITE